MSEGPVKIVIADDHQMFIDGVKVLIRNEKRFEIIGEALNGEQALELVEKLSPQILITDINMPGMSGTELTKLVKQKFPETKVLVLTMYNDREIISEIFSTDAEGYILKNTGKQELIAALSRLADDGTFYSNEVMSVMLSQAKKEKKIREQTEILSPRELEIIQLITQEFSTAQIAEKLFISPRTVDTHRKNIIAKTGVRTIVGLIRFAYNNDLVR
jgi:DNA-binding NarL/FixJ family response regulator